MLYLRKFAFLNKNNRFYKLDGSIKSRDFLFGIQAYLATAKKFSVNSPGHLC